MNDSHDNTQSDEVRARAVADALRTRYWCWTIHSQSETPPTLRKLLCDRLPHIPEDSWPSRFVFGGIYINGLEALDDQPLTAPCRIEYYEPKFEISAAALVFPEFKSEYVLFQDEHILIAYKPAGLSSMPAKEQRHFSVKASIERLLGTVVHMPSRLDVSAQGLIIMSISPLAHAELQKAFEMRRISKTYVCASDRKPDWKCKIVSAQIGRDSLHPVLRTTKTTVGQQAETIFDYLGENGTGKQRHILSARPITGRTHQIRVHAAHESIPLLGDRFYGGAAHSHLHLVSYALSCLHPVSKKPFSFSLPPQLHPDWMSDISLPPRLPEKT